VTRDRLAAGTAAAAEISSSGAGGGGGNGGRPRYKTVEKRVRREFTVILLVICASVLSLTLPYFFVWCRQYLQSRLVYHVVTDRVSSRQGKAIGSVRPSVCLSVRLFPLYRLKRLTFEL